MVKSSFYLKIKSANKYIGYNYIIDTIIMIIIMNHIMLLLSYKPFSTNPYLSWSSVKKTDTVLFSKKVLKYFEKMFLACNEFERLSKVKLL